MAPFVVVLQIVLLILSPACRSERTPSAKIAAPVPAKVGAKASDGAKDCLPSLKLSDSPPVEAADLKVEGLRAQQVRISVHTVASLTYELDEEADYARYEICALNDKTKCVAGESSYEVADVTTLGGGTYQVSVAACVRPGRNLSPNVFCGTPARAYYTQIAPGESELPQLFSALDLLEKKIHSLSNEGHRLASSLVTSGFHSEDESVNEMLNNIKSLGPDLFYTMVDNNLQDFYAANSNLPTPHSDESLHLAEASKDCLTASAFDGLKAADGGDTVGTGLSSATGTASAGTSGSVTSGGGASSTGGNLTTGSGAAASSSGASGASTSAASDTGSSTSGGDFTGEGAEGEAIDGGARSSVQLGGIALLAVGSIAIVGMVGAVYLKKGTLKKMFIAKPDFHWKTLTTGRKDGVTQKSILKNDVIEVERPAARKRGMYGRAKTFVGQNKGKFGVGLGFIAATTALIVGGIMQSGAMGLADSSSEPQRMFLRIGEIGAEIVQVMQRRDELNMRIAAIGQAAQ